MAILKDLLVTGQSRFIGDSYGSTFHGNLDGNATSATKLQTSRNINGTSFNGTAAITTANWGTARNISISDSDGSNTGTAVSVNGSAAVTLKLPSDIKAKIVPLLSKTYTATDFYASGENWESSTRYFMSVVPVDANTFWRVKYRIVTWIPGYPTYSTTAEIEYTGYGISMQAYSIFNTIKSGYAPYYHVAMWLTATGLSNGYGHAIGESILYATNYTTAGYYRNMKVDVLEYSGCTVTLLDTAVKWASWTGTGSTNYARGASSPSSYNATSQGLQESGDSDSSSVQSYDAKTYKVGDTDILAYNPIGENKDGLLVPMLSKPFVIGGPMYIYSSKLTANSTSSWVGLYYNIYNIQIRNGSNYVEGAVYKPLYLKGTISNGLFTADATTPYVTALPASDDGFFYYYLGETTTSTASSKYTYISFRSGNHPIFFYKGGSLQVYGGNYATSAASASTATTATTATNLAGGAAGSIPYQSAAGTTTFLAKGSDGAVLKLSGGVPTWGTDNNSDTKVTQTVTSSSNTSFRPLILGDSYNDGSTFSPSNTTASVYASHLAKFQPSTGKLYLAGLGQLSTSGTVVTGSDTKVFNTNGGVADLANYAKKDGTNATGTWPIAISGNAATSTSSTSSGTSNKSYTIYSGETSTSDTNGHWTATINGITSLYDGLTIHIKINKSYYSNSESYNTLNINGLGHKLVWYRYNSRLTSHVPIYAELVLTYRTSAGSYTISTTTGEFTKDTVCTDGWVLNCAYYSDSDYQAKQYYWRYKVNSNGYIARYSLVVECPDGTITSLTLTNNSTETSKTMYSGPIVPGKIFYYASTTTKAAGAIFNVDNTMHNNVSAFDARYTFNCGQTLTANIPVYLVLVLGNDGYYHLDSTPWTQTLPTTEDNKLYSLIGVPLDNYEPNLEIDNTVFWYKNGQIRRWEETASWAATAGSTTSATTATNLAGGAAGSLPYQSAAGTTTFLAKGSDGQVLKLSGGVPTWSSDNNSDTKNTAGTTNKTGTKMYIVAATEQSANPQTYSNVNVYVGTDNCLYSNGTKVLTSYTEAAITLSGTRPSNANGYTYVISTITKSGTSGHTLTLGYTGVLMQHQSLDACEKTANKKNDIVTSSNVTSTYYPTTQAIHSYVGGTALLTSGELSYIFGHASTF